ncbi:ribosomal protein S30-domain-containing protein [Lanmaoa asiatica]|nr:ribosomal protein S30-domain-containing protein [Lanmaoa asiatica]
MFRIDDDGERRFRQLAWRAPSFAKAVRAGREEVLSRHFPTNLTSELYSYSPPLTDGHTIKSSFLIVDNMGKVHGSLARAGKVKSQTPKVEKQEKKKTPRGRAKKRMLYNRRFVNVTTLPGGKRRMNPNPEK